LKPYGYSLFSPQVFEGHPFMVEAGVSIGGKDVKQVRNYCFVFHKEYFLSLTSLK
jgi:hypothetical protein